MTIHFEAGSGDPAALLREAEDLVRAFAEDVAVAGRKIREGEFGEVKTGMSAVRDLRQAFLQVMEERTRVEKLRKQVAGTVGGNGELDLAAARAEIGRRLARLRDAGGGG